MLPPTSSSQQQPVDKLIDNSGLSSAKANHYYGKIAYHSSKLASKEKERIENNQSKQGKMHEAGSSLASS
jgi:hypothetical protein